MLTCNSKNLQKYTYYALLLSETNLTFSFHIDGDEGDYDDNIY